MRVPGFVTRPWELVNAAARAAYAGGILHQESASLPVISVGGIAAGGTGKTPLVIVLARTLAEMGASPAVLSRGYRRRTRGPVIALPGATVAWEEIGDEPALIAASAPRTMVVADSNRGRAARLAAAAGASHLILDDGFQHFALRRDVDVIIVDGTDPLSLRGPRREAPGALRHASVIVVSGGEFRAAEAALRPRAPAALIVAASSSAVSLHVGADRLGLDAIRGRGVHAFAGIARPERFFATLRGLGAHIVRATAFPDHHRYRQDELQRLAAAAARDGLVPVTTAKDAVKLPAGGPGDVWWLEVELVLAGSPDAILAPFLARVG